MRKHFDFYAYCSPTSGKYYIGDTEYDIGEDFRTAKRYREYKDAGFNILLLQHENTYNGEDFSASACRRCMTEAAKAGIDKVIVSDGRLKDLCADPQPLLGENGKFADENAFLDYLSECVAPYGSEKNFYGVQLYDEPEITKIKNYGLVCKGLKKLFPDIYLQCNLMPVADRKLLGLDSYANDFDAYEYFVNAFLDESEIDYVLFDEYPFRCRYILCGYSLRTYQIVSDICKRRGKEMRAVLQSFACLDKSKLVHRPMTERDLYWEINLAMGFGVKEYSFFTYFTKPFLYYKEVGLCGDGVDGAAMVNRDGTKTKLYYGVQKAIREIKKFEPVLIKYDFDGSYLFFPEGKTKSDYEQTNFALAESGCPISVEPSCEVALVTHLTCGNSALYMVENIGNVKNEIDGGEIMKAAISFGEETKGAKKINFYRRAEKVGRKISENGITETLPCGEALFIEIVK